MNASVNVNDLIESLVNQLNEQKLALKEQLSAIDKEIDHLNEKIRELEEQLKPLVARRAELMSQRVKVAKLLSLLEPTENMIIVGETVRRKRAGEVDSKVYELLSQNPNGLTQTQIASLLGLPPSTVYHSLNRLAAAGRIEKNGSRYRAI